MISLNDETMWFEVIDREAQFEIIRLNTDEQLYNQGIDSKGVSLGEYSEVSVEVYLKPEGHIRLYEEGDFYDSFTVYVKRDSIEIYANDIKEDVVLTDEYGIDILGLTDDNMNILIDMLRDNYIKQIYERLRN